MHVWVSHGFEKCKGPKKHQCIYGITQGMGCEGACAHAHVRCAVARVHAKSFLKSVSDVPACATFSGVRCAITLKHTFCIKTARKNYSLF
jgi:hypothetical protein